MFTARYELKLQQQLRLIIFLNDKQDVSTINHAPFSPLEQISVLQINVGPGSSVGITTGYGLEVRDRIPVGTRFSARSDWPWGPPSLLYNGYRVFPGSKVRPWRAADHSPPSSAAVMEEQSYTSTHPLGHTGPVTGKRYLYLYLQINLHVNMVIFYFTFLNN